MGSVADPSTALEAVLSRFRAMVASVAARHALRDADLDALVQEVRIRLWRSQSTSEEISTLPTSYVYQTAMSAAIDLVRKRRRTDQRFTDDEDDTMQRAAHSVRADDQSSLHELSGRIEGVLEQMIPARRVVVRMSLAGYARQEIVERLGWTDAKVRNLLSRGMEDLRQHLRPQLEADNR